MSEELLESLRSFADKNNQTVASAVRVLVARGLGFRPKKREKYEKGFFKNDGKIDDENIWGDL